MKTIKILGTDYKLILKNENEDPAFKECGGYRDAFAKEIVVADYKPNGDPMETKSLPEVIRLNTRHEIIHAFLGESGLLKNTENDWASNEEMVDWIAIQGPKIYAAWKEAGAT